MGTNRDELFFWFDQPPKVSKGAYNYISSVWGNKVWYIALHDFPENRKASYSDDTDYGEAELIMLSERDDANDFVNRIIMDFPNAVHVLNGFHSDITNKVFRILKTNKRRVALVTERPILTNRDYSLKQFFKNRGLYIKYVIDHLKFDSGVSALLPSGRTGEKLMLRFGWDKEKVFPFMYCPLLADVETINNENKNIRFLYVGRFNKLRHMDHLMAAFDAQVKDNWHFDLVGGYGDMAEEVITWAEKNPHVSFLGRWPSKDVGKNMANYDVYILPTMNDGWNAQLNEVINAGIAAITTDEAVSDELISTSGAGMVISANSERALTEAISSVLEHPEIIQEWKKCALEYKWRINGDIVGNYFIDIMDYTFYSSGRRPICPWLEG